MRSNWVLPKVFRWESRVASTCAQALPVVERPTCSLGPSRSSVAKEREEEGRVQEEVALDTRVGSMSTPRLAT